MSANSRQQVLTQHTDRARPFCTEACRQDGLEFESNNAASRNRTSNGSHRPCAWLHHPYTGPYGDVPVLQSPPVCPGPSARPLLSHTHLRRDMPGGDNPGSQHPCPHSNRHQGSQPAVPDGAAWDRRDSEARQSTAVNAPPEAAEKVKFTHSQLLSSPVLRTMLTWPPH